MAFMVRWIAMAAKTLWMLAFTLTAAGCGKSPSANSPELGNVASTPQLSEAEIQASEYAKMEPGARKIAQAQGYCVVSGEPLGSMGVPYKVAIDDQRSVYVCCKGCEAHVKENPDAMLAKAEELKSRVKTETSARESEAASSSAPETSTPAAGETSTPPAAPQPLAEDKK